MLISSLPVLGFCAFSGVGKTSLLTQVITILQEQGVCIGVIKQSHHDFEIDNPKKDSFKLRQAGARQLCLSSAYRDVFIREHEDKIAPSLAQLVAQFDPAMDIILVEGFKTDCIDKIECFRPSLNHPMLAPNDKNIIAIATDDASSISTHLPLLDINNAKQISAYIIDKYLS